MAFPLSAKPPFSIFQIEASRKILAWEDLSDVEGRGTALAIQLGCRTGLIMRRPTEQVHRVVATSAKRPSAMNDWYCHLFGQEMGPMSQQELIFLAEKGNLRRDTLVCRGTERVWLPAAQFRGLFADEHRQQSARVEPCARERPRLAENRGRSVSPAFPARKLRPETAARRTVSLPSLNVPSLPWFKALTIFLAIAGIAGVGRAAYQVAGTTRVNHGEIVQQLERHFAEVDQARQTNLDYVTAAILQGRLRAQIHALRLPLRNSATGTLEATLDAAAESVLTMAEHLAVAKSPASEQVLAQKADAFQRLIAQAKQSTSGA